VNAFKRGAVGVSHRRSVGSALVTFICVLFFCLVLLLVKRCSCDIYLCSICNYTLYRETRFLSVFTRQFACASNSSLTHTATKTHEICNYIHTTHCRVTQRLSVITRQFACASDLSHTHRRQCRRAQRRAASTGEHCFGVLLFFVVFFFSHVMFA
jgi:hypothetical protein